VIDRKVAARLAGYRWIQWLRRDAEAVKPATEHGRGAGQKRRFACLAREVARKAEASLA